MAKVITIYGTRPEAIKLATVLKALNKSPLFDSVAVSSGQHRHMLEAVNEIFGLTPTADLDIFSHGQTLASMSARVMRRFDQVLVQEDPDVVLVQGDTTTAAVAALCAAYRKVPVVHLEAGLRSGDIASPFPEEINRRVISQVAELHLAPTPRAALNLANEGITHGVYVTGNTVIDALLWVVQRPNQKMRDDVLVDLLRSDRRIVLVTSHRRENWGEGLSRIGQALGDLAQEFPYVSFVIPVHVNPLVRDVLLSPVKGNSNVIIVEPLSYADFAQMLKECYVVLTDSGGVQEEAPSLGKPVLVLRENTERPEVVEAGTARLVGTGREAIAAAVRQLLTDPLAYATMAKAVNPFGDGKATERVISALAELLGLGQRLPEFGTVSPEFASVSLEISCPQQNGGVLM